MVSSHLMFSHLIPPRNLLGSRKLSAVGPTSGIRDDGLIGLILRSIQGEASKVFPVKVVRTACPAVFCGGVMDEYSCGGGVRGELMLDVEAHT